MSPQDFCYWLKGFTELHGEPPSPEQWECINEHLNLVFTKVTAPGPGEKPTYPSYPSYPPLTAPYVPVWPYGIPTVTC